MSDTTFIYALCDPISGDVRYVGKSNNPAYRLKTHARTEHSKKSRWVGGLIKRGLYPVMELVDEVPQGEWSFWEQFWIQQFMGWGFNLLNGDRGGLGNHRLTPELKAKISATLAGRPAPSKWREIHSYDPLTGRYVASYASVNEAGRAVGGGHGNILRALRDKTLSCGLAWAYGKSESLALPNFVNGVYSPPECVRERLRETSSRRNKGRVFSQETKARMRAAAIRRWHGAPT